jgi:hypothetical protein
MAASLRFLKMSNFQEADPFAAMHGRLLHMAARGARLVIRGQPRCPCARPGSPRGGAGVLVDRVADAEKPERLAFSFIHKWNFLFPVGRLGQNVVVGVFGLALIGFMAVLGLRMDLVRRLRLRRRGAIRGEHKGTAAVHE